MSLVALLQLFTQIGNCYGLRMVVSTMHSLLSSGTTPGGTETNRDQIALREKGKRHLIQTGSEKIAACHGVYRLTFRYFGIDHVISSLPVLPFTGQAN